MITVMLGTAVRSIATFLDEDTGLPIDPTTLFFRVKNPSTGVETSFQYGVGIAIVRDSLGVYHTDYLPTIKGDWKIRWVGTDAAPVAGESIIRVLPSAFVTP